MNITIGELKEMLEVWPDDTELNFSGLDFYRLKQRGPKLIQVEFNQLVYKDKGIGKVIVENLE
ncbi:hypothetical protein ACJJIQ_09625 [Microbulbifer sp. ANSA003]|uniref:hypothetical protein n=1 Tax=unclassified Microbulbifer TaxID=2619833 RepID=UPI00403A729E